MNQPSSSFIAFDGDQTIALGTFHEVALKVREVAEARPLASILVFNATTSEQIDFDYRGTADEVLNRLASASDRIAPADPTPPEPAAPAGPGRPRLGVIAREVTLLPRHWEWLSAQSGGASVALRKLVEQARRSSLSADLIRQAQNATFRFMTAMTGNQPGYEEAVRALFATDRERFDALIANWPEDIRAHLQSLANSAFQPSPTVEPAHA